MLDTHIARSHSGRAKRFLNRTLGYARSPDVGASGTSVRMMRHANEMEAPVVGSDKWCNALYFPHGRHKLGGMFCRLEIGHDGEHWCEQEDDTE